MSENEDLKNSLLIMIEKARRALSIAEYHFNKEVKIWIKDLLTISNS